MFININIKQKYSSKKIKIENIDFKNNKIIINLESNINKRGFPSYVRIINGEEFPTILRSKNGKSYNAEVFSNKEMKWVTNVDLWHEYVDMGIENLDYCYLNEKEIEESIPIDDKTFK